jgi:hypothetical protein
VELLARGIVLSKEYNTNYCICYFEVESDQLSIVMAMMITIYDPKLCIASHACFARHTFHDTVYKLPASHEHPAHSKMEPRC